MTVVAALAELVARTACGRRALVAVDGVDGSGKTTLADRLASEVAGRAVVRASVDAFHRPRAARYRRGRESPEGCYEDTFDLAALRAALLDPFAAGGPFVTAVFDHARDAPVDAEPRQAAQDAVLVVDGVFLQRPELSGCWDLFVHLQVADEEVLRRVVVRDGGEPEHVRHLYCTRYLPAQRLYEHRCRPAERADVLLDNSDPAASVVLRWASGLPAPGARTVQRGPHGSTADEAEP